MYDFAVFEKTLLRVDDKPGLAITRRDLGPESAF